MTTGMPFLAEEYSENYPTTQLEVANWKLNDWAKEVYDNYGMWEYVIDLQQYHLKEQHPWLGREQRAMKGFMRRWRDIFHQFDVEKPEMPLAFPDDVVDETWVRNRIDEINDFIIVLSNMCCRKWRLTKAEQRQANRAKQALRDDITTLSNILNKAWVPNPALVQKQIDRVEYICVLLYTGLAQSFNRNMSRFTGKIAAFMYKTQRDYFDHNKEHNLGWVVEDWVSTYMIPISDRGRWWKYYHQLEVPEDHHEPHHWWKGISYMDVYEEVLRTDIMELRAQRMREINDELDYIKNKQWSMYRFILTRERALWGNMTKGRAALIEREPVPTEQEIKEHMDNNYKVPVHWRIYNMENQIPKSMRSPECRDNFDVSHYNFCSWQRPNSNKWNQCKCGCHLKPKGFEPEPIPLVGLEDEDFEEIEDDE